jgi:hypothetical protein
VSTNSLRLDGLEELRAQLRALPSELTAEASRIVDSTANAAAVEVRTEYGRHNVSGSLQAGVVVTHVEGGKWSAGAILKSMAKHAWLFENGSQARHTDLGADRGSMPPAHVFVPAVMRARRSMYQKLKDMLVRNGMTVTGEP